jgi:hypothetical protein
MSAETNAPFIARVAGSSTRANGLPARHGGPSSIAAVHAGCAHERDSAAQCYRRVRVVAWWGEEVQIG